jgi:tetratricopeptide (TPR) repeat protein
MTTQSCLHNLRSTALVVGVSLLAAVGCANREAYQLLDLAHRYEGAGHEIKAIEAYAQAVAAAPHDAYLQRALGRAYLRRQEWDLALEALQESVALEPAYLDAYQDLIAASLGQDDTNAALAWLERAAHSIPNYAPLYERLVTFYAANDRQDEAMQLLNDLALQFPDEAWIPFRQGTVLRHTSRLNEALDMYDRARALDDALPDLWAEIGNVQFDLEAYDEAVAAYTLAIEQDPLDHRSMNNLAWVYAVRGREIDRGIELSRASLELREEPSYMDTLAELYYKQGDRRRALILIRRAIRMGSDSAELNTHLQKQLDRFQQAHGRT